MASLHVPQTNSAAQRHHPATLAKYPLLVLFGCKVRLLYTLPHLPQTPAIPLQALLLAAEGVRKQPTAVVMLHLRVVVRKPGTIQSRQERDLLSVVLVFMLESHLLQSLAPPSVAFQLIVYKQYQEIMSVLIQVSNVVMIVSVVERVTQPVRVERE